LNAINPVQKKLTTAQAAWNPQGGIGIGSQFEQGFKE
jgi:hypothetical protein